MSKIIYSKQSAADLEYKLFLSPKLDLLAFNILQNKELKWHNIVLNFSIIGASHYVVINTNNNDICNNGDNYNNRVYNSLVELIACVQTEEMEEQNYLQEKRLIDCKYHFSCKYALGYKYSINTWSFDERIDNYQYFQDKHLSSHDNLNIKRGYLEYIFPAPEGLAITSIEIFLEENQISWVTYHSYPEDQKIIKTLSILERGE